MKDKAKANFEAAMMLLGARLCDPAMSRLYYALFQAGIHAMAVQDRTPADYRQGASLWTHHWICDNALLYRNHRADRVMFERARSLRERADYREQRVPGAAIQELVPQVRDFITEVCA